MYSPLSASSPLAMSSSNIVLSVSPNPSRLYLFRRNSVLESMTSCVAVLTSFPSKILSSNAPFSSCGAVSYSCDVLSAASASSSIRSNSDASPTLSVFPFTNNGVTSYNEGSPTNPSFNIIFKESVVTSGNFARQYA